MFVSHQNCGGPFFLLIDSLFIYMKIDILTIESISSYKVLKFLNKNIIEYTLQNVILKVKIKYNMIKILAILDIFFSQNFLSIYNP